MPFNSLGHARKPELHCDRSGLTCTGMGDGQSSISGCVVEFLMLAHGLKLDHLPSKFLFLQPLLMLGTNLLVAWPKSRALLSVDPVARRGGLRQSRSTGTPLPMRSRDLKTMSVKRVDPSLRSTVPLPDNSSVACDERP